MRAIQPWLAERFDDAPIAAVEAVRFARELGAANVAARPLSVLAFVAAIHGDDDEARRLAGEVLEVAAPHGLRPAAASAVYGLAMLDLGRGRWIEALERVEILDETAMRRRSSSRRRFGLAGTLDRSTSLASSSSMASTSAGSVGESTRVFSCAPPSKDSSASGQSPGPSGPEWSFARRARPPASATRAQSTS